MRAYDMQKQSLVISLSNIIVIGLKYKIYGEMFILSQLYVNIE